MAYVMMKIFSIAQSLEPTELLTGIKSFHRTLKDKETYKVLHPCTVSFEVLSDQLNHLVNKPGKNAAFFQTKRG